MNTLLFTTLICFASIFAGFWSLPSSLAHPPKANIIIITIDALRQDHLGCYGYQRNTSPAIDNFSKEAVIFKQVVSQSTLTMPSLASLITSVYPTKHGIFVQNADFGKLNYPTIIDILKGNGYRTAVFFPYGKIIADWLEKTTDYLFKYPYTSKNFEEFQTAPFLTSQAVKWIKYNSSSPFFMWVHYNEPHAPYRAPSFYKALYLDDEIYKRGEKRHLGFNKNGFGAIPLKAKLDNREDIGFYIAQYDSEIRYVDYWVGRLLDRLKALKLYDDSLIIISSDHGEGFGEHNLYCEHGMFLYDELVKVPLIIKFPKNSKYAHAEIKEQVRLVDIMPTILNYLNLSLPGQIDGMSLLPLLGRFGGKNIPFAFSKIDSTDAIRSEGWKLIYSETTGQYELYDLKNDPGERQNIYVKEGKVSKKLSKKLNNLLNIQGPAVKRSEIKDNDTKSFMKSLGYLQ